jgi:hypothetical protein
MRGGVEDPRLWKVAIAGGVPELVTTRHGRRPVFSHDGSRLAYFTSAAPTGGTNLAIMDWPDGPVRFPVAIDADDTLRGPFWMRDNRRVIAHGRLGGAPTVGLYLLDTVAGRWTPVEVPGALTSGHASFDRHETTVTFDGARPR